MPTLKCPQLPRSEELRKSVESREASAGRTICQGDKQGPLHALLIARKNGFLLVSSIYGNCHVTDEQKGPTSGLANQLIIYLILHQSGKLRLDIVKISFTA